MKKLFAAGSTAARAVKRFEHFRGRAHAPPGAGDIFRRRKGFMERVDSGACVVSSFVELGSQRGVGIGPGWHGAGDAKLLVRRRDPGEKLRVADGINVARNEAKRFERTH